MEMLPGETLAQRLRRAGRMQPGRGAAAGAPHGRGAERGAPGGNHSPRLQAEQRRSGAVEGEPREMLRAVVTDFGLAQTSSGLESSVALSVTGTGEVVGSPAYTAPEQLGAEETTAAADIYAFGVVIYEMVAGQPPFAGDTPFAVAIQRLQGSRRYRRDRLMSPIWIRRGRR